MSYLFHIRYLLFLFLVGISSGYAQSGNINITNTALPFLLISLDVKSNGNGSAGIGMPADANSTFTNLAKLAFSEKKISVSINHLAWLSDIGQGAFLSAASGYLKTRENSALSTSIRYFSPNPIQLTDFSGNLLSAQTPSEYCFDIGYSSKINSNVSIGVASRYIRSKLMSGNDRYNKTYQPGSTFAVDFSMFYTEESDLSGHSFSFGAVVANLGAKIGYTSNSNEKDFIPATLKVGVSYKTFLSDESEEVRMSFDINKVLLPKYPAATGNYANDSVNLAVFRQLSVPESWAKSFSDGSSQLDDLKVSAGVEFKYNNSYMVRTGYHHEAKVSGNGSFVSFGVGINTDVFELNFAYLSPISVGGSINPLLSTLNVGVLLNLK